MKSNKKSMDKKKKTTSKRTGIRRKYKKEDSALIGQADGFVIGLNTDYADFTAFRASFNAQFKLDFEAAIQAAKDAPKPLLNRSELKNDTQEVVTKIGVCSKAFGILMYSVKEAFPKQPGIWDAFGRKLHTKSKENGVKMVAFMRGVHDYAEKYHTELIAVGYTQLTIDNLETLMDELQLLVENQETQKQLNSTEEEAYVIKLNTMWGFMGILAKAAKIIYATSPSQYRKYLLYPESDIHVQNISEDVPAGGFISLALNHPIHDNTELNINNDGTIPLRICRTTVEAACGNIPPNEQGTVVNPSVPLEINAGGLGQGEFLIVSNFDPNLAGHITLTITWI